MSVLVTQHPDMDFDERRPLDFYPTPLNLCRAALVFIPPVNPSPEHGNTWVLDPGAGTGVWGRAAFERWPAAHIVGIEYRQVAKPWPYDEWYQGDFLAYAMPGLGQYDVVIGNPPYGVGIDGKVDRKMGEKFVRRGMDYLRPGGTLLYLMLLNFFTTQERVNGLFMRDCPLQEVIPLLQRPSFKPGRDRRTGQVRERATDAREYALFRFVKGGKGGGYRWCSWDNKEQEAEHVGPTRPDPKPSAPRLGANAGPDIQHRVPDRA